MCPETFALCHPSDIFVRHMPTVARGEGDGVCNVLTYCVFTFIAAVSIIINNDGGFRGEDCTLVLRFRVFVPGDCRGCILGRRRLKDPSDIFMYKINLLPPIKKH